MATQAFLVSADTAVLVFPVTQVLAFQVILDSVAYLAILAFPVSVDIADRVSRAILARVSRDTQGSAEFLATQVFRVIRASAESRGILGPASPVTLVQGLVGTLVSQESADTVVLAYRATLDSAASVATLVRASVDTLAFLESRGTQVFLASAGIQAPGLAVILVDRVTLAPAFRVTRVGLVYRATPALESVVSLDSVGFRATLVAASPAIRDGQAFLATRVLESLATLASAVFLEPRPQLYL